MAEMKLIYLACPYSSPDLLTMRERTLKATAKTAELMAKGYNVFSPLTHSDSVADFLDPELRWSHDFWLSRDFQILSRCDEVHVLCLDGWNESYGVGEEIKKAQKLGIPLMFHRPDGVVGVSSATIKKSKDEEAA